MASTARLRQFATPPPAPITPAPAAGSGLLDFDVDRMQRELDQMRGTGAATPQDTGLHWYSPFRWMGSEIAQMARDVVPSGGWPQPEFPTTEGRLPGESDIGMYMGEGPQIPLPPTGGPSGPTMGAGRYGVQSYLSGLIGEIRNLSEAGHAYLQAQVDPLQAAALYGKPIKANVGGFDRFLPQQPATPEELQRIAATTPQSAASRDIEAAVQPQLERLKRLHQIITPPPSAAPQTVTQKIVAGLGQAIPQVGEFMLTRRMLPIEYGTWHRIGGQVLDREAIRRAYALGKHVDPAQLRQLAPASLDFLRSIGTMATLGTAHPALRGEGPAATAKGLGIGAAAGAAFGLVPYMPPKAAIPTVFAIGAGQAAIEGGSLEDQVASGATLAIAHVLLSSQRSTQIPPGPGRPSLGPGITREGQPPYVAPRGELGPGVSREGQPGPARPALRQGAIPAGPEEASALGQRITQLVKDGYDAKAIAAKVQQEGFPWDPRMDAVVYEIQSRLLGRKAGPAGAGPQRLALPPSATAGVRPTGQTDPTMIRMQELAEVGFSPGQIVKALQQEGHQVGPQTLQAATATVRVMWNLPRAEAPAPAAPAVPPATPGQPTATTITPPAAAGQPTHPITPTAPPEPLPAPRPVAPEAHPSYKPLVEQLKGIGYKATDAKATAARVIKADPNATLEELFADANGINRKALKPREPTVLVPPGPGVARTPFPVAPQGQGIVETPPAQPGQGVTPPTGTPQLVVDEKAVEDYAKRWVDANTPGVGDPLDVAVLSAEINKLPLDVRNRIKQRAAELSKAKTTFPSQPQAPPEEPPPPSPATIVPPEPPPEPQGAAPVAPPQPAAPSPTGPQTGGLSPETAKLLLSLPGERMAYPFGDQLSNLRVKVIEELTGVRLPKAKAGAGAVREALAKAAGVDMKKVSIAEGEEKILDYLRGLTGQAGEQPITPEEPFLPEEGQPTPSPIPAWYQAALEAARKATQDFNKIQEDYRAKRIGDQEFLEGKRIYDAAAKAFDDAYRRFSEESSGEPTEPTAPQPTLPQVGTSPVAPPTEPPVWTVPEGPRGTSFTSDGKPIDFVWRWLDPSADVITSHDVNFNPNPRFPSEVQNRNRMSADSQAFINRVAKNPIGPLLGQAPVISLGAPWIMPSGVVAIGNARVIGVLKASPEKRAKVIEYLKQEALKLGIPQAEIDAKPNGMLFRQPVEPVGDAADFAIEGNTSATPGLSPGEQARTDASIVPPDAFMGFKEGDESNLEASLRHPRNREFVTDMLSRVVPKSQMNTVVDPQGNFNRQAVSRVAAMMLQKAYEPSQQLLDNALESVKPEMANTMAAYANMAGAVLKADAKVAEGSSDALPVGKDLGAALSGFMAIRESGQTVEAYLHPPVEQMGLPMGGVPKGLQFAPRQEQWLRELNDIGMRSSKLVRDWIAGKVDPILTAPDVRQGAMFDAVQSDPGLLRQQGYDTGLIGNLRDLLAPANRPEDTALILRDGWPLSFYPHGSMSPFSAHSEIIEALAPGMEMPEFLRRTGAIRVGSPTDISFVGIPSPQQIQSAVRMARSWSAYGFVQQSLAGQRPALYMDADDPRSPGRILWTKSVENPTVESVQEALKELHDLYRMNGWLDGGQFAGTEPIAQFDLVKNPDGSMQAVPKLDPRLLKVLGGNLYRGELGPIAVKELIQNAVDSFLPSRLLPGMTYARGQKPKISVDINTNNRIIDVQDNGEGMLPERATETFVNPGGSEKLSESSVGGYGAAKIAIFANATRVEVTTRARDPRGKIVETKLEGSGDDWISGKGFKAKVTEKTSGAIGTAVKLWMKPEVNLYDYTIREPLDKLLAYSRLPMDIKVKINDVDFKPKSVKVVPLDTVTSPGASIDFYASEESAPTGQWSGFQVRILNNGMYQFDQHIGVLPGTMMPLVAIANVRSSAGPDHPNYPFEVNRQGLRAGADDAVKKYVDEKLVSAAIRRTNDRYNKAWAEAPLVPRTQFKVVDASQKIPPELMNKIVSQPHLIPLVLSANDAFEVLKPALKQVWGDVIDEVHFAGVILQKDARAIIMRMKDVDPTLGYQVLINPYTSQNAIRVMMTERGLPKEQAETRVSNQIVASIVHEFTHPRPGGWDHGPTFASEITEAFGIVVDEMPEASVLIQSAIGGPNAALDKFAADYESLSEHWTKESIFGPLGISLGISGPSLPPVGAHGGATQRTGSGEPLPGGGQRTLEVLKPAPAFRPGAAKRVAPPRDIQSILDAASLDTRLTAPGPIGNAGLIEDGKLTGIHMTADPGVVLATLKAGSPLYQARQGGDLGGGLYFSGAPQLWRGRGRQALYDSLGKIPDVARRQQIVDAIIAASPHTFSQGYLTRSEQEIVWRDLQTYVDRGDAYVLGSVAGQPYNMDVERGAQAAGVPFTPPAEIPVSVQGKFLRMDALTGEQVRALESTADIWLQQNGYIDANGKETLLGKAVTRRYGSYQDLFNEYLRSLDYDGVVESGGWTRLPQTAVWNSDAVRQFGDWHNPRPAPGTIGDGEFFPPRPGYVRLFRGEGTSRDRRPPWLQQSLEAAGVSDAMGRWFTDDPNIARWYSGDAGPLSRIVFVDVPAAVAESSKVSNVPEAARFSRDPEREFFVPPEFAVQKRPLWSRGKEYALLQRADEIPNPYDTSAMERPDLLPMRQRFEALWTKFDTGELSLLQHTRQAQELRRAIAESILRSNPLIVGTVLTDGKSFAFIHPGSNRSEPYRLTTFDKDGPVGHTAYPTAREAMVEAIREQYVDKVDSSVVDQLAMTPAFQRGADAARVTDFFNQLSAMGHPSTGLFNRLPWEIQLKVSQDPQLRQAFIQGQVPREISQYATNPSELLAPPPDRPAPTIPLNQAPLFPSPAEPVATQDAGGGGQIPLPPRPITTGSPEPPPRSEGRGGVELGFFMGVPRLNVEQRRSLMKALWSVFGKGTEAGEVRRRWLLPGVRNDWARNGWTSLEGFARSLGGPGAKDLEMANKNRAYDEDQLIRQMFGMIEPSHKEVQPYLQNLYEVLRGKAAPANAIVQRAVDRFLGLIDPVRGFIPVNTRTRDIRGFTGPGGFEGPPRPFKPRTEDIYPIIYPAGYIGKVLKEGTKERADAIRYVSGNLQVSPEEAQRLIDEAFERRLPRAEREEMRKSREGFKGEQEGYLDGTNITEPEIRKPTGDPTAPGLTRPRRIELPGHVKDPFVAWGVRIRQAAERFAFHDNFGPRAAKVFGDEDAGTAGWLDSIQENHGTGAATAMEALFKSAYGGSQEAKDSLSKFFGGVRNYESLTKLPGAFVQNLGQNSLAGITTAMTPWFRAVAERSGLLGPDGKARARQAAEDIGILTRSTLRDLETVAGISQNAPLSKAVAWVLAGKGWWPGVWGWSEVSVNRTLAPRTMQIYLQSLDRKLHRGMQLRPDEERLLGRMGIDPKAVQEQGGITAEQARRGMWGLTDETQFFERPGTVPPHMESHSFYRMLFQWKGYALKYNRWLWNDMGKELLQHGNARPLIRFMIVAPVIGEIVGGMRAMLGRRDRKWIWDDETWDEKLFHWFAQNPADAYGIGVLGDMLNSLAYGSKGFLEWATGAGLSQMVRTAVGAAQGVAAHKAAMDGTLSTERALERWYRDTARAVIGEVPLVGRPFKARAWSEAEQMNQMKADLAQAMHKAAEFQARAFQTTGQKSLDFERKAQRTLDDVNRKYRNMPGFEPIESVSRDSLREALRALQETPSETARRRMPKIERGIYPPTLPGEFKKYLDLLSSGPPQAQDAVGAGAAALVAMGPGKKFEQFVERVGEKAGVPMPPPAIMALTSYSDETEKAHRERMIEALPPERRSQVRTLLALQNRSSNIS